jgi:hypothetical protein
MVNELQIVCFTWQKCRVSIEGATQPSAENAESAVSLSRDAESQFKKVFVKENVTPDGVSLGTDAESQLKDRRRSQIEAGAQVVSLGRVAESQLKGNRISPERTIAVLVSLGRDAESQLKDVLFVGRVGAYHRFTRQRC